MKTFTTILTVIIITILSSLAVTKSADLTDDGLVNFDDLSIMTEQWLSANLPTRVSINVKDYGAIGNGSTNDSAAINAAIAALPSSYCVLYFPAGVYRCGTVSIKNKTGLTICGDGWASSVIKSNVYFDALDGYGTTPGGQVINIGQSCSNVLVFGLTFDGNCTHRKAGQQAVMISADNTTFRDNYTMNSGEFANCFGRDNSAGMDNLVVTGNRIGLNWADGINLYNVKNAVISNNIVDGANDDLIAVSESSNVVISSNVLRSRTDLPSKVGRGIAVLWGANNVHGTGNLIEQVKQYVLYVASEQSGARPNNITFCDTTVRNAAINSGSAVFVERADNVTLLNTRVFNPGNGSCIYIADWNNLTIAGGELTQTLNQYCRGIHVAEQNGYTSVWSGLIIKDLQINLLGISTNEALYLRPLSYVTMDIVLLSGITARNAANCNYISVDTGRCATMLKIINNASLNGRSISPSSSGGIVTVANNN
ncbi:MAG: hypothetical protein A2Y10_10485 [Planctomycetes bacterium GWF2_41_51]|nr:MAG: hypothetical protein A2Y10_10485 [Planctomycetes bacterium GWF2_41_51]HBG26902.1 hypothetical protein [Phycisphaerales bacterium]